MKALLLLSGGIDSPVAAHKIKNKGVKLIAIHFSLEPFTDNLPEKKSTELCRKLGIKKLFVTKQGDVHSEIVDKCEHKYYYIISRRLMWKIAEKIAEKEDCKFLVTGENLGQVGSQTLENMAVIDNATKMEILRPLLTYDKNEIINIAKEIGTYNISKGPEMCSILGPKHPATKSTIKAIEEQEKNLDIKRLINQSLEDTKVVEI